MKNHQPSYIDNIVYLAHETPSRNAKIPGGGGYAHAVWRKKDKNNKNAQNKVWLYSLISVTPPMIQKWPGHITPPKKISQCSVVNSEFIFCNGVKFLYVLHYALHRPVFPPTHPSVTKHHLTYAS